MERPETLALSVLPTANIDFSTEAKRSGETFGGRDVTGKYLQQPSIILSPVEGRHTANNEQLSS